MPTEKGLSPLYTSNSKILILGTFPSKISRETNTYYANKGNRFWNVICSSLGGHISDPYDKKIQVLKDNDVALWDLIDNCEIDGSKDSKIKNPVFNDIQDLLNKTDIEIILLNGKTKTLKWYEKNFKGLPVYYKTLPSTSRATPSFDENKWFDALIISSDKYENAINYYIKLMGSTPLYKTVQTETGNTYIFNDYGIGRTCAERGLRCEILKETLTMKIKQGKL